MPTEFTRYNDLRECVELAKGIIYMAGLTQKQVLKTISILDSLSPYTDFARYYGDSFRAAAVEMGVSVPTGRGCSDVELRTVVANRRISFDNPHSKIEGVIRGLSHGFHRKITLPQIMESAIKTDYCDEHVLLIESDFRSIFYKKKEFNPELVRFPLILISGMADKVGVIRGSDYSNEFYRRVIQLWKPDVYFINQSAGTEAIKEAEFRANSVGAKLMVIGEMGTYHTTDLEKFFKGRMGEMDY